MATKRKGNGSTVDTDAAALSAAKRTVTALDRLLSGHLRLRAAERPSCDAKGEVGVFAATQAEIARFKMGSFLVVGATTVELDSESPCLVRCFDESPPTLHTELIRIEHDVYRLSFRQERSMISVHMDLFHLDGADYTRPARKPTIPTAIRRNCSARS